MRCALFGKLPSKRDFVAPHVPRSFLEVWEPWINGGISASRQALGEGWQEAYLKAPIWRFWLGASLCGATVAGAFMSSLDGVGRYFPLTALAYGDEGAAIPPPELNAQDSWFDELEEFLLSTLDETVDFDAVSARLEQLPLPSTNPLVPIKNDGIVLPDGAAAIDRGDRSYEEVFASIRLADHAGVYAGATFWWTLGGEGFRPIALSGRRMPNPFLFTEMLTGQFGFGLV